MNLGLAIFLSSLILGLIFLFHSTKDRWNWKKIIKFASLTLLSIIILLFGYYVFFYSSKSVSENKPVIATELWDINLDASKDDVKFLKGKPDEIDSSDSIWLYFIEKYYRNGEYYKIVFNSNQVTSVVYFGGNDMYHTPPYLSGRTFNGYSFNGIERFLGKPTNVYTSKDGLRRVYSYNNFNMVFFMEENKVYAYGIYNPKYGTYKY